LLRGASSLVVSTASLRFATALLQATVAIFLALSGFSVSMIPYVVIDLWVSTALGSLLASLAGGTRSAVVAGLSLMAIGLAMLALRPGLSIVAVAAAGVGSGMAGSVLAPSLHRLSSGERPLEGVATYSLGLSLGLIAATLTSSLMPKGYLWLAFLIASIIVLTSLAHSLLAPIHPRANLSVRLPGPKDFVSLFKTRRFANAFYVNLLYSTIFPLVLSYWPLYAVKALGLSTMEAFGFMAAMFSLSAMLRFASAKVSRVRRVKLVALGLLVVSTALLSTGLWPLALAGLLLFAVPHAVVYPVSLYESFASAPDEEVKANYVISISSGVGEVISPFIASVAIALGGLHGTLYLAALPLALGATIIGLAIR